MRLPTIFGMIGLVLAAFGAFWYWQTMQVAVALAYANGGPNVNRTLWYAIGLVGFGLAMFLICVVIIFVVKDCDAEPQA
jgi:hypothetical protein